MKKESLLCFVTGLLIGFFVATIIIALCTNPYDANRDGKVTSQDYVVIKNYIMKNK